MLILNIQHVVIPGTTIWFDEWAAYGQLLSLGFVHETVTTRAIKRIHRQEYARTMSKPTGMLSNGHLMVGTSEGMVSSHRDKHMWCQWFGSTEKLVYVNMKCHIVELTCFNCDCFIQ